MRIWLALIVAPVLALESQSIAFALAHWACEHQSMGPMHATLACCLGTTVVFAALAWQHGREGAKVVGAEAHQRQRFLAGIATAAAGLSSLVIAAMWVPAWMLSPCFA